MHNVTFAISPLCVVEVNAALLKKIIYDLMYQRGIPFEDYPSYKNAVKIKESEIEVFNSAKHYLEKLNENVTICYSTEETSKNITKTAIELIVRMRTRSHDAILLGEACSMKAEYFITNDKHLIRQTRDAKFDEVKLVNPRNFYLIRRNVK